MNLPLKDILWHAFLFILIVVGIFVAMNQVVNYQYKMELLQDPCSLCEEQKENMWYVNPDGITCYRINNESVFETKNCSDIRYGLS